jgi:surface antigen
MKRSSTRLLLTLLSVAAAGGSSGVALAEADALLEAGTLQEALESTRILDISIWANPDGDGFGTITPLASFENDAGASCRNYRKTVVRAGLERRANGTACRSREGDWQILSEEPLARVLPEPAPTVERTVVYRDRVVVQPIYVPTGYAYAVWQLIRGERWGGSSRGHSKRRYRVLNDRRGGTHGSRWSLPGSYFFRAARSHGGGHGKRTQRANFRRRH